MPWWGFKSGVTARFSEMSDFFKNSKKLGVPGIFFEANQKLSVIYNFYELLNKIHGGNLIIFGSTEKLLKLCTFWQKPLKMVGRAKCFWKVSIEPLQLQIFCQNVREKFPGCTKYVRDF